ncbi:MAG: hypothetical protein ACKVT0_06075, partial [Planctomycetaceae bacterium]
MSHRNYMLGFIVIGVLSFGAKPNFADDAPATTPREPRQAIEKGLEFLVVDSVKWKKEHNCATCHHGTMTTFALTEAKSLGFPFAEGALEENATWSKDRWMAKIDSPRDTRAGHSMVNTPAIYLALMALANPKQESLSPDDLKRI